MSTVKWKQPDGNVFISSGFDLQVLFRVAASMDVDWDTGLPSDVLALVAKKGRANQMKIMREVSKSWQQGFELAVRGISIGSVEHPVLPWGLEVAQRFPALTQLGLGNSLIDTAWLETLQTLPNLNRLFLGGPKTTLKISDADMVHLQVWLTVMLNPEQRAQEIVFEIRCFSSPF